MGLTSALPKDKNMLGRCCNDLAEDKTTATLDICNLFYLNSSSGHSFVLDFI